MATNAESGFQWREPTATKNKQFKLSTEHSKMASGNTSWETKTLTWSNWHQKLLHNRSIWTVCPFYIPVQECPGKTKVRPLRIPCVNLKLQKAILLQLNTHFKIHNTPSPNVWPQLNMSRLETVSFHNFHSNRRTKYTCECIQIATKHSELRWELRWELILSITSSKVTTAF